MSEDETIKYLENVINTIQESDMLFDEPANIRCGLKMEGAIQGLLDLYQQEKEKNKELTEIKQQKLSKYLHENLWICKDLSENYIHKQKIREKIKELEGQEDWYIENKSLDDLYGRIDELKELLEEE